MARAKSKEIAVRLRSDVNESRSMRVDDRVREFGLSLPGQTNGNSEAGLVAKVDETKKEGYALMSGTSGDITRFRIREFPGLGDVELRLGVRGISVEAAQACLEGLTLTLLEVTGTINANKENTDR